MTVSLCPCDQNSALLSIPGFRFHPTDIELLNFYLKRKITGKPIPKNTITELDIYQYPPWDLSIKSASKSGDPCSYFFCPNHTKYPNGSSQKVNRATGFGYWKCTGNDREIHSAGKRIGWSRILVFHVGKPKKGDNQRTDWVMHEYRLDLDDSQNNHSPFVLCKIFKKSGVGPSKSGQFGAPFVEQDWGDDEEEEERLVGRKKQSDSVPVRTATADQTGQDDQNDKDFEAYLLDFLDSEDDSIMAANEGEDDDNSRNNDIQAATIDAQNISRQDSEDIFKNLEDLKEWKDLNAGRSRSHSGIQYYYDHVHFMEVTYLDPSISLI